MHMRDSWLQKKGGKCTFSTKTLQAQALDLCRSLHIHRGLQCHHLHLRYSVPTAKRQESAGVLTMVDLLVADLDKETTAAEVEEKNSQEDSEKLMADAREACTRCKVSHGKELHKG